MRPKVEPETRSAKWILSIVFLFQPKTRFPQSVPNYKIRILRIPFALVEVIPDPVEFFCRLVEYSHLPIDAYSIFADLRRETHIKN